MPLSRASTRGRYSRIEGVTAHCTGSLLLEVIFGFPDNFRSENLTFHIAPFQSGYQALLGREAFARFNAIPHYASLHHIGKRAQRPPWAGLKGSLLEGLRPCQTSRGRRLGTT